MTNTREKPLVECFSCLLEYLSSYLKTFRKNESKISIVFLVIDAF